MLTLKDKKLFDSKISYSDKLVKSLINKSNIPNNLSCTIGLCFFNSPKIYYAFKRLYPNADVKIIEDKHFKNLYNIPEIDTIYIDKANLETLTNMNILKDLYIIANPPYGAIGANITDTIRQKVDYDQFVNLLPANDYKRNKTKDLFNYQSEMEAINDGFADATVTTHLARIHKNKVNNMTEADFTLSCFNDKSLTKYFNQTLLRKHYAIDSARRPQFSSITTEDNTNTILFGIRDMNHQHLSFDKNGDTYRWNVLKAIDINKLKSNIGLTGSKNQQASHYFLTFKTSTEKDNFAAFMYSVDGFRFLSKIFKALNTDSMIALSFFLPKVDWSRSWTVAEILANYGYTANEIAEVIADLTNFKGIDD